MPPPSELQCKTGIILLKIAVTTSKCLKPWKPHRGSDCKHLEKKNLSEPRSLLALPVLSRPAPHSSPSLPHQDGSEEQKVRGAVSPCLRAGVCIYGSTTGTRSLDKGPDPWIRDPVAKPPSSAPRPPPARPHSSCFEAVPLCV